MSKAYTWHRFWLPAESSPYLDEEAYLPDPTVGLLAAFNPGAADLTQLSERPCKVLLGESGMGKSSTLRTDCARLEDGWAATDDCVAFIDVGAVTSLADLRLAIEDDPKIRAWRSSGRGVMNIHVDSLDEAVPAYPAISKGLMTVIKAFGSEQLRLSIACRTGEFPPFLEEELAAHFGADNVTRWHLAPLTRGNIQVACDDNAVAYDDFMTAVREGNLQPLAARPITLDLLLRTARDEKGSIRDGRALYERGCRELISERTAGSRSTQGRRLDLDQSMAVAGRMACVTVFGARMTINAERNAIDHPGVVTTADLAGDQETVSRNTFAVTEPDVLEVLRTGLFTANGLRFRWSHKSYAEFMAARHLCASGMPTRNRIALVTSGRRVPAALRGVAGWLSALDPEIFAELLGMDPEAMLHADLSLATNEQRAEIVDWLLKQGESDSPLIHEPELFLTYRKLRHPGLIAQLQPVIERSAFRSARYCAIEIADACGEASLQASLADLALRLNEDIYLRIAAASSVADHGDLPTKTRLLPLALRTDPRDDEQRLQTQALKAAYPHSCSWAQLRDSLGGSDYSLITGIGRFIGYELPETMEPEEWPEALAWLSRQDHPVTHGTSAWAAFGDQILHKAAPRREASTQDAVLDLLHSRLSKHEKMFGHSYGRRQREPWSADVRRPIAAGLVPRLVPNLYAAREMVRGEQPLLGL